MKKLEYIHPDTYVPEGGENPVGESETVPNQALHIREIMERSARGQILPEVQYNELQYGDDLPEELADLDDMDDFSDIEEKISYYENRVKEMKDAKEAAKKKEEAEKAKRSEADEADGK